jgi:hypothetical protein
MAFGPAGCTGKLVRLPVWKGERKTYRDRFSFLNLKAEIIKLGFSFRKAQLFYFQDAQAILLFLEKKGGWMRSGTKQEKLEEHHFIFQKFLGKGA